MTIRTKMQDIEHAKAVAREVTQSQRKTCEGCALLRMYPRPMCQAEASPHWRTPREPYHDRCDAYAVTLRAVEAPEVKEAPPMSRCEIAGEVPRLKRKRVYVTGDVARRLA